jgi:hypothetical protein
MAKEEAELAAKVEADRRNKKEAERVATQRKKRWYLDHEIEQETEGRISASRLRKDRLAAQIFPFHRIGKSCFYDLDEINELIEKSRFGGNVAGKQAPKRAVAA